MSTQKVIGLTALLVFASCGPAKEDPKFDTQMVALQEVVPDASKIFDNLPLEGSLDVGETHWSGDYWAVNKGSITRRWRGISGAGPDYVSPTREELQFMTEEDLSHLSPAEKFDLLLGRYDYPLKEEIKKSVNPLAASWEGLGNGWAMASIYHKEPFPTKLKNPDGLEIPFGSTDIKALLTYYYAMIHRSSDNFQLGTRCEKEQSSSDLPTECKDDLDAGLFHILLANRIGVLKKPLIMDKERYKEVWNHPIIKYKSQITKDEPAVEGAPAGTVRTLTLRTSVTYVEVSRTNGWGPVRGTYEQVEIPLVYVYLLHLGADNEVIASNWITANRPDFLWIASGAEKFEEPFSALSQLLTP